MLVGGICLLITWVNKMISIFSGIENLDVFYSYISPTVICIAVVHLVVFSRINIGLKFQKLIAFFSPAAFGAYLFHMQWDILDNTITTRFRFIADLETWKIPIYIVGCASIILIMGLVIDKIRGYLFAILKIDKLAKNIEKKIRERISYLIESLL